MLPVGLIIEPAHLCDAGEILELQKIAFQSEAKIYGAKNVPPLFQTLESLQQEFQNDSILKASFDGKIIGTVRFKENEKITYIGRLAVHPIFRRKGVAAALMSEVEKSSRGEVFKLFTGERSKINIGFYQKIGYRITHTTCQDDISLVHMSKKRIAYENQNTWEK